MMLGTIARNEFSKEQTEAVQQRQKSPCCRPVFDIENNNDEVDDDDDDDDEED